MAHIHCPYCDRDFEIPELEEVKMSEIRGRAKEKVVAVIHLNSYYRCECGKEFRMPSPKSVADVILSIPELVVVDREAELPKYPYPLVTQIAGEKEIVDTWHQVYDKAQQDMLKAGYVKEVKQ